MLVYQHNSRDRTGGYVIAQAKGRELGPVYGKMKVDPFTCSVTIEVAEPEKRTV